MMLKNLKNVYELIGKKERHFYLKTILMSTFNTLSFTLFLVIINLRVTNQDFVDPTYDWAAYLSILLLSLILNRKYEIYLVQVTNNLIREIELRLITKIAASTMASFEKIGYERILNTFIEIPQLGAFPRMFASTINCFIVITSCFAYMIFMLPWIGFLCLTMVGIAIFIYWTHNKTTAALIRDARKTSEDFYLLLNDLVLGRKELKNSPEKERKIIDQHLKPNRLLGEKIRGKIASHYILNQLVAKYGTYALIGIVLFLGPSLFDYQAKLTSVFVICILYLIPPFIDLITQLTVFNSINEAIERAFELQSEIQEEQSTLISKSPAAQFERLTLNAVKYRYNDNHAKEFELGPIDLQIDRGSVVFITGGNGSGKSTLLNLISGQYLPESGGILFNKDSLTSQNIAWYRQHLSVIHKDHYMFTYNYTDHDLQTGNSHLSQLKRMIWLSEDFQIIRKDKKINTQFSSGQKKRLALILSLLDDREILVLDEWAAEQDQYYRKYFYQEILPSLKKQNKTIIIVTHDDKYFTAADLLVKLEYGKITETVQKAELVHRA